jgi:transcriptional regulator with XRE-family HTH domain
MKCLNMVGPQVRKLRYVRGWSQNVLAAKLQVLGWDIDRGAVAKIESRLVHVDDYELLYFSRVFRVELIDMSPRIDPARPLHEIVTQLMHRSPAKSQVLSTLRPFGTVNRNRNAGPRELVPNREQFRR